MPRYGAVMATDVAPESTFGVATRRWFEQAFGNPTPAQAGAWPAIARGEHVLVCAPTGSGKTLAAFLAGIDRLLGDGAADRALARRCSTSRR